MKHLQKGRKFGRVKGQRKALLKNLAAALIERGRITTTVAKAKELKPLVDQLIGKAIRAKSEDKIKRLHCARLIKSSLPQNISLRQIDELSKKFPHKKSGFTRVIKIGQRKSDGSPIAMIELVDDKS